MNKMKLREIIFGNRRERVYTDETNFGGIICPLIKMNGWEVYIYGGGQHIEAVVLYLWNLGIEVNGILDCDSGKEGKTVLDKVPILNPNKIKYDFKHAIVLINIMSFEGIEQYEILNLFSELGISRFYELNEAEKKEIKAMPHVWADVGRIEYYRKHCDELEEFYEWLYDNKSKEIMLEYIRTYMQYGTFGLKQGSSDVKYFYGLNEDGTKEELYTHLEDEVWVNCGSNKGDNIFWFFANGLNAKKIYAYEAERKIYTRLVKNLEYLPEGYRKKVCAINEFIDDKTDWSKLETPHVTLINADIEGGEMGLLMSMKDIISVSRPVLAICAYHKAEDLVELPTYIKKIVGEYCFVLRKYESNVANVRRTAELVLYAIPKERIKVE